MSSIREITSSTLVPPDLAEKIGVHGVNEILAVLWRGYHDLKDDASINITLESEEDEITQEWFVKILRIWDSRNRATAVVLNGLTPIHQYGDNTMKKRKGVKAPTIDFCFKDWKTTNCYFGSEAKNLYDKKPEKVKRYVDTGVGNYITGRYGSQSSESSVVGYVLSGNISDIVDDLKVEIHKLEPISNLARVMTIAEPQYKTRHNRTFDDEEITIHHLFFNFVA